LVPAVAASLVNAVSAFNSVKTPTFTHNYYSRETFTSSLRFSPKTRDRSGLDFVILDILFISGDVNCGRSV
jgi:hypothetical protein